MREDGHVPDVSGRDLLREWQKLMESVVSSAGSLAGRAEITRPLLDAMQRQLELVQDFVDRERALRTEIAGHLLAPVDAVLDLLAETGETLRRQAGAIESAGRALEETAGLMKDQAELFERTIGALRQPVELARSAATAETPLKRRPARKK
jgi:hypothetical protein